MSFTAVLFNGPPSDRVSRITDGNMSAIQSELAALGAAGYAFRSTVTLTSAAAGTPVNVVPAASVGASQKVYITAVFLKVGGATAWTDSTGTKVQLQDTAGTPLVGMTWLKALLTGNAVLSNAQASTILVSMVDGFTVGKGLDFVADHDFAAGSTITITVHGYVA
jgi:hypothetical protein